jgi:type IV secretion system protein VirD4
MYGLARLFLIGAAGAALAGAAVAGLATWPMSGYAVLLLFVISLWRRRSGHLTTLGSARWADEGDLRGGGLLGAERGLILGRLLSNLRHRRGTVRKLFDLRANSREACRAFFAMVGSNRLELVRLPRAIHLTIVGPTGGGKGVSFVLPHLLTSPESSVVVDLKGENAQRSAQFRKHKFGHTTVLLDPFKIVTQTPDTFNPLDFIAADDPHALDVCNDLAKALVMRTGEEREPHWNDSAEAWIAAVLATVVKYGERGESRSLQTVRDLLSQPQKLEMAVRVMCESDCWGGMLARMGGQLLHFVEKEKSSTLTTVNRHLRFLDTLAVAESTKSSSFDPTKLRTGKMTVYLILPPEHMRAQGALLRVWIESLLKAAIGGGLQERNKVHFVLDEAASLGHLDSIDAAVDKYRGYGVRLQFYFQSLGQLRKCFPDGQEQTLLSNTTQVFFGVNDNATADYVSARLGESTIVVDSGGKSSGGSTQWSESTQPSSGGGNSYTTSRNWQQQARKLLKPEEIMALPLRTAITFTNGMRPICTTLLRYYEERRGFGLPQSRIRRMLEAVSVLVVSALLCAVSWMVFARAIEEVDHQRSHSKATPTSTPKPRSPKKTLKAMPPSARTYLHKRVQRDRHSAGHNQRQR